MTASTLKESISRMGRIGRPGMIRLVLHLIAIAIICFAAGFCILALSETPTGGNPFAIVNKSAFVTPVVSTVPLDNATSGEIAIISGIGELQVHRGQNGLLTTTVYAHDPGAQPIIETDMVGTKKIVKISERNGHPVYAKHLDLAVTDKVPIALAATTGPGDAVFELGDLNLTSLQVTKGLGDQTINLAGYRGTDFDATITHDIGDLTIQVPKSRNVRIHLDMGPGDVKSSGLTKLNGSYVTTGSPGIEISVIQGIGSVNLEAT